MSRFPPGSGVSERQVAAKTQVANIRSACTSHRPCYRSTTHYTLRTKCLYSLYIMIPPPASHPSDSAPGDKPDNLAPSPGNLAPSLKRRRQPTPTTESSQGSSSASSSKEQSSGSSLGSGSLDSATHELIEMASRIAVKKGREAAPRASPGSVVPTFGSATDIDHARLGYLCYLDRPSTR